MVQKLIRGSKSLVGATIIIRKKIFKYSFHHQNDVCKNKKNLLIIMKLN